MELLEFLRMLYRHRAMIALLCLSAAISAAALTYAVTERFESKALVLVRPQEKLQIRPNAASKESLDFPLPQLIPFEAMSRTYGEVIKSNAIVDEVVRRLGLDQPADPEGLWQNLKHYAKKAAANAWTLLKYGRLEPEDPLAEARENLQKFISVEPTRDTYVFEITFLGTEPNLAAAVVNTAAETFVEQNRALARSENEEARAFLSEQLAEAEAAVAKARAPLQKFKEANRTVLLDRELSGKTDALVDTEVRRDRNRTDIERSMARVTELERSLKTRTDVLVTGRVQEDLTSSLLLEQTRLAGLRAEQKRLDALIEDYKESFGTTRPAEQLQYTRLQQDLDVAEGTYKQVRQAYDEAVLRASHTAEEIRVISPGLVPTYPKRPVKILYVAVSAALALVVGIAVALLAEYLRVGLHTVKDAEQALGLPLLATIPPLDA
jgi:uncharacterized protein involved in exopolysaccharide biosynthesis